jgi:tetratricopeptide (TPR) repeat protein
MQRRVDNLIALALTLVTLIVYLPVTGHGFLDYDDDEYVTENPIVQNGLTLAGIKWAFTTNWASNWHPLTWISHMADCTLFDLNPGPHHLVNVIFHALNAALVFLLWLRLTNQTWPAAFVAALFAWHPLHVESVAWIAERKDVLSTFFALLALISYAKYVQANARRSYWFALLFFFLGLLSKPMLVTLPFVMLLLDFWPLNRIQASRTATVRLTPQHLVKEKIPFFVLTTASCVVTFLAQHHGQAVATLEDVPVSFRLENATVATAIYLAKMFWPAPLAVCYPLEPISPTAFFFAAGLLATIFTIVWLARDRNPCWLTGWLWFLGMLVPVIGLVQVGSAAMADRYTYLPSIGIFVALAFGLQKLSALKKIFPGVAILLLCASVATTEWQLHYWRNSETLFRHALVVTKDNGMARLNLAITLDQQNRYEEALVEYREALRLGHDQYKIHYNIGCLLDKLDRPAESLAEFYEAIRFDPKVARWHCAAGTELAALGRLDEAMQEFAEAERLKPGYAQPHIETAKLLFQQGRDLEATTELHLAVHAEPENYQTLATVAHYFAANENAAARDGKNALILALRANGLSGRIQPMVVDILGMACAESGDFTNAIACARGALELASAAGLTNTGPMQMRLELYQNGRPWRESFRATNTPSLIQTNR